MGLNVRHLTNISCRASEEIRRKTIKDVGKRDEIKSLEIKIKKEAQSGLFYCDIDVNNYLHNTTIDEVYAYFESLGLKVTNEYTGYEYQYKFTRIEWPSKEESTSKIRKRRRK